MSQWIHRKGYDKLIQAFSMEFNDTEDAAMIIKTYGNLMWSATQNMSLEKQAEAITKEAASYRNSVIVPGGKVSNANIAFLPYVLPYENISWLYE